jgi:hypothetical protein
MSRTIPIDIRDTNNNSWINCLEIILAAPDSTAEAVEFMLLSLLLDKET